MLPAHAAAQGEQGLRTFRWQMTCSWGCSARACIALAASQPPTIRNYTVSGYEKRPTPPGLLAVLQDYFERHKAEYTREVRTLGQKAGIEDRPWQIHDGCGLAKQDQHIAEPVGSLQQACVT